MGGGCGPEPSELDLSVARARLAATTITCPDGNSYALFGGGVGSGVYNDVDVINCKFDLSTLELSKSRRSLAATTITCNDGNSYALFGGGSSGVFGTTYYNDVDVLECCDDGTITHTQTIQLSSARNKLAATTITYPDGKSYALFGGGNGSGYVNDVDVLECCDGTITRTQTLQLQNARAELAATTITCPNGKSYALFGGGNGSGYFNDVDVFECCDVTNDIRYKTTLQLSVARSLLAATTFTDCCTNKEYALFGGGAIGGTYYNTVNLFDCTNIS